MSSDALAIAIDRFYDAAVNPALWNESLGGLCRSVDADGAVLIQFGAAAVGLPAYGIGERFRDAFMRSRLLLDQPLETHLAGRWSQGGFTALRRDDGPEPVQRMASFLEANDIGDAIYAHVWGLSGENVILMLLKSQSNVAFNQKSVETLNGVFSHIRRALSLGVQLGLSRGAGLLDGLSTLKCGAALFDSRGTVLKANGMAETILSNGMSVRQGRIMVSDPRAQSRLDGQIADAIDGREDNDSDHGDFVVIRRPRATHPLIIQIIPVRSRDDVFRAVRAIALFNDLTQQVGMRTDMLKAVLDLRPSEARVASLLATGYSLDDIADELNLKRETVRSYVKNILSKARVNKQSAFVAIASRMGRDSSVASIAGE
jgi:DNA-binding CsgD family transcriptional regulator